MRKGKERKERKQVEFKDSGKNGRERSGQVTMNLIWFGVLSHTSGMVVVTGGWSAVNEWRRAMVKVAERRKRRKLKGKEKDRCKNK